MEASSLKFKWCTVRETQLNGESKSLQFFSDRMHSKKILDECNPGYANRIRFAEQI